MVFKHGTSVSEVPSKIKGMVTVTNPIVCVGSAPINMGDITNINKPQLIYTTEEAAEYFGGTNKIPGFTISEFLNAAFNIFKITPVLCINVCDPEKHGEEVTYTDREIDVEKKIIFEAGIIPETLIITDSAVEPELKHDLEFDGYFEPDGTYVAEITTEDIPAGTIIEGSYTKLDPSLVTDEDIIGGIDLGTLKKVGLEVVNNIFSAYSMIPSVVITPSFYSNEVRAALDAKTSKINNKWGAVSFIDMPEDLKYGECIEFKKENNWIDSDQMIFYGRNKLGDGLYWQSILAALLKAEVDASNDGVPYESPSNKNIKASGICYKDEDDKYIDVNLDEEQANLLNANGITTTLKRSNGTVLWGNRTSVFQPGGETDPKETWLVYKCMFKYIANTLMLNTEADVDKPMTFTKAQSIKTNMNLWLSGLTNAGKLYGGRVEFIEEENPDILEGNFVWHIYIGTVTPGESLHFILEYDSTYAITKLFAS